MRIILLLFALTVPAIAADAPPTYEPTAVQKLAAMQRLCELAKYASRIEAETPCAYFLNYYQAEVNKERTKK